MRTYCVVLAFLAAGNTAPNNGIWKLRGGVFSSKSRSLETFLKSHWPELGHVFIPKVVIGKGERAGFQADLLLGRLYPIPEHLWGSVGRKMMGVNVQLETH